MIGNKKILGIIILALCLPDYDASAGNYESYHICRECHTDIFNLWSSSLHAKSYTNSSFQASYLTLVLDEGKDVGNFCLKCHAPVAHLTKDFNLKSPSAAEGVSCWFCHSISSINQGESINNYYNLDTSGTVYGPYKPTISDGHQAIYSPLHHTAQLCAGCHEYANEKGVRILETFTEWQESPYSKDEIYCQSCHMPIMVDMSVVDNMEISNYYVTAHEFRGGHSNVNLTNAVNLKTKVSREGSRLDVKVLITNAESGHKLPTGIPIRKLVLKVALKTDNNVEISSSRKVYRKVLTDKYGTIIENAADMFLYATSIYSDNRIKPQETREENFIFILPHGIDDFQIEAVLSYEYTRPMLKEELIQIQMAKNVILSRSIR